MVSRSLVVAALVAAASAAPSKCNVNPTLPVTGDASQVLAPPDAGLKFIKIAVGHGIQNYTCASADANVTATGALAVLYDATHLYPGTRGSGLATQQQFDSLTSTTIWTTDIPLHLQNPAGANPLTPNPEKDGGAVIADPWVPPRDLVLGGSTLPFLGRHYFDVAGRPTFDLSTVNLLASVRKAGGATAPANSDKGTLKTSAVDWLKLTDNQLGLDKGIKNVYRVITAGGASVKCADLGATSGSVPYTAFYWFYG